MGYRCSLRILLCSSDPRTIYHSSLLFGIDKSKRCITSCITLIFIIKVDIFVTLFVLCCALTWSGDLPSLPVDIHGVCLLSLFSAAESTPWLTFLLDLLGVLYLLFSPP